MDEIMHRFDFPGMKVPQFAFLTDPYDQFLPHTWETSNLMVYPGTHDNDTTMGWWEGSSTKEERVMCCSTSTKRTAARSAWDFDPLAWSSIAKLAVVTAQDLLSLGRWARMNVPS